MYLYISVYLFHINAVAMNWLLFLPAEKNHICHKLVLEVVCVRFGYSPLLVCWDARRWCQWSERSKPNKPQNLQPKTNLSSAWCQPLNLKPTRPQPQTKAVLTSGIDSCKQPITAKMVGRGLRVSEASRQVFVWGGQRIDGGMVGREGQRFRMWL